MRVALVTRRKLPELDPDEEPLHAALLLIMHRRL